VQTGRDNSSAALNLARLEREVDAVEAALVAPRVRRHSEYVSPTRVAEAPAAPDAAHAWEETAMNNAAAAQRAAALAALRARGAERHARRASALPEQEGSGQAEGAAARSAAELAHAIEEDAGGPVAPEAQSPVLGGGAGDGGNPMAELARLQQMHAALTAHIDELQATLLHAAVTGGGGTSHESLAEAQAWEDTTGSTSDGPEDGMRTPPCAEDAPQAAGAPASPEERYIHGQAHAGPSGGGAEPLLPRDAFAPTGGGAHVRVNALRAACEESLGAPLFNKLYAHFKQAQEQANAARGAGDDAGSVPGAATDEVAFREELRTRLGPGRAHFVALMDRLLFEEEQVSGALG
jgi:hypothetical protein